MGEIGSATQVTRRQEPLSRKVLPFPLLKLKGKATEGMNPQPLVRHYGGIKLSAYDQSVADFRENKKDSDAFEFYRRKGYYDESVVTWWRDELDELRRHRVDSLAKIDLSLRAKLVASRTSSPPLSRCASRAVLPVRHLVPDHSFTAVHSPSSPNVNYFVEEEDSIAQQEKEQLRALAAEYSQLRLFSETTKKNVCDPDGPGPNNKRSN